MRSIEITNLEFSYNSAPFLKHINLTVDRGEMIGLIGPNGCGKTTLISLLRGFLKPAEGKIMILGKDVEMIPRIEMGRLVSYVPQESRTSFNFTAYEIVSMGRYAHQNTPASPVMTEDQIIMGALELTDSKRFAHQYFWNLSGGEKQRIILARAIAQQAEIILLDEPTASLDIKQATNIYKVINKLNETAGLAIVAATHDVHLAGRFCSRLVMMKEGTIVGDGLPEPLFEQVSLEELYDIKMGER